MNTKRNYLYNVLSELITTLIPLVTTPYAARILGTDGLGAYQYVMTVASYFVLFANFGIKAYGNRCIAQARDDAEERNRIFSGIFRLQRCLSLAVCVLYGGYVFFFGGAYRVLFCVFGINLLSAVLEITWLYFGMETFAPTAILTVLAKLAGAVGIFLLVRTHDDLPLYALLCSAGVLFVQLCLWLGVRRYVRFVKVPFSEWKKHFLPCLTLLIPMLAPTLFRTTDKLMLEGMSGQNAVGLYSAADQLQTCLLGFITGLGTVMLPRASHLLSKGKEGEATEALALSMQFSLFLGNAFSFGIAAAADVFVPYYYGASFSDAASLTAILTPTIFFISFTDVIRSQYIIPHKRDSVFLISVLCGAGINLLLNRMLIPVCLDNAAALGLSVPAAGALGALPGTLLAELSVGVCQYIFLRKELSYRTFLRTCAIFPLSGAFMFAAVKTAGRTVLASASFSPLFVLCAEIALGAFLYLGIVFLWYFRFRRDTLRMLFRK